LEKLHDVKVQKLLEEKNNLVKLMDELAVDYQNSENKSIQKDEEYRELQEKYTRFKERNITSGERLTELDKFRYEEEIVDLNKSIEQLKGKNKQIDELKESITLSSKTANILVDLEKENRGRLEKYIQKIEEKYEELNNDKKSLFSKEFNEILGDIYSAINALSYEPLDKEDFEKIFLELEKLETKLETFGDNMEEKIDEIQKRFNQIKYNPKNEKRLRRIFRQIYGFENKLEEIRKGTNPKITLRLLQTDLEKIEKIMKKSRLPVYGFYCILRAILLGGILLGGLVILFLNEPFKSLIEKLF
jgi:DNA repair exonuclease SbcCD ATPase subunit